VPIFNLSDISNHSKEGNWSKWEESICKTLCLEKSKGVQFKRRFCRDENNKTANCKGLSYDVMLCDDSTDCKGRWTINEFIAIRCGRFRDYLPQLEGNGIQEIHKDDMPWRACTIFCQKEQEDVEQEDVEQEDVEQEDIVVYYDPSAELINLGVNPYLPDGTWCHSFNGVNYFCRKHYCMPENY
jgi:hypothetical protein